MSDDDDVVEAVTAYECHAGYWRRKARDNVAEWGLQSTPVLMLAVMEELGELSQAYLEERYEDGDAMPLFKEMDDLAPLMWQLMWRIQVDHDAYYAE